MKRIIKIFVLLFISLNCFAQKATNTTKTFDDNFNPTITTSIQNTSNKTISKIFVTICYRLKGTDAENVFATVYKSHSVSVIIPPNETKKITVTGTCPKSSIQNMPYRFVRAYISSIIFTDGTYKDY